MVGWWHLYVILAHITAVNLFWKTKVVLSSSREATNEYRKSYRANRDEAQSFPLIPIFSVCFCVLSSVYCESTVAIPWIVIRSWLNLKLQNPEHITWYGGISRILVYLTREFGNRKLFVGSVELQTSVYNVHLVVYLLMNCSITILQTLVFPD